jgi:adenylate kinase
LKDLKINPSLIVLIDANDNLVENRLTKRKTDPLTGQVYNKIEEVTDKDIKSRLITVPNEKPEIVKIR